MGLRSPDSAVIMGSKWELHPRGQALKGELICFPQLGLGKDIPMVSAFIDNEKRHRAAGPLVHSLTALGGSPGI